MQNILVKNKKFSIVELLTVVLIILLLISLIIPNFAKLKMSSRQTLCKSQMKQIYSLMNSYATDNGGYLPNDDAGMGDGGGKPYHNDIPATPGLNNALYMNWNGHLLNYLNLDLPDRYYRNANFDFATGKVLPAPLADKAKNAWAVINDAVTKGGYQDLRLFICPEIWANTFDVHVSDTNNGIKVPRISNLFTHYGETGTPTTYLANWQLFGMGTFYKTDPVPKNNSLRLDEIPDISGKLFLLEGGLAQGSGWCYARRPFFYLGNIPYEGYDLGRGHPGDIDNRYAKTTAAKQHHKLSFVHDNHDEFWISSNATIPNFVGDYVNYRYSIALKFNQKYAGKAYMIPCTIDSSSGDPSYVIVSYIDPQNGTIFDDFLKENPGIGNSWGNFEAYVDSPNDFHYLVGDMNVLLGDGSVTLKDTGWLTTNRLQYGRVK